MLLTKQIDEAFTSIRTVIMESVNLDVKTKNLIALSNAAIIDCPPCVETAYKSALGAGATPGEIAEAIAIAMEVATLKIKVKTNEMLQEINENAVSIQQIDTAYSGFQSALAASPNLNVKTKELIALSNSAIIDSKPGMKSHYKSARNAGATSGEIAEVLALAMVVAGGKIKIKTSETIARLSEK